MPRARVLLPCWLALVLVGCSAPLTAGPSVCDFVRRSVADGSMPLSVAQGMYPECSVNQGPR